MHLSKTKIGEDGKEKELEATRRQLEESACKINSLEMQIEEKEMSVRIKALPDLLVDIEPDMERFKSRVKELERNANAATVLKAEQKALLRSLRKDLKAALDRCEDRVSAAEHNTIMMAIVLQWQPHDR
jgi:chromosome segregation ATPase